MPPQRWLAAAAAAMLLILACISAAATQAQGTQIDDTARRRDDLAAAVLTLHAPHAPHPHGRTAAWNLAGAEMQPVLSCADADGACTSHRVSWSAATVAADPAAPPLLYSVFAQWTAPATAPAKRHSLQVCTASSAPDRPQLHCDIPADSLPRDVELSMQLHTSCDLAAVDASRSLLQLHPAAWVPLPNCLAAMSPAVVVTLPREPVVAAVLDPVSAPAPAHQNNSAAVRAALCSFYALSTATSSWTRDDGWCISTPGVSYCEWFGVGCDADGNLVSINLASNMLGSSLGGTSFPGVFSALASLQTLNLSSNFLLSISALDLSNCTALSVLDLSFLPPIVQAGALLPAPLTLPQSSCALTQLVIDGSFFHFTDSARHCTGMQKLAMRATLQPMNVTDLLSWPALRYFDARGDYRLVGSASAMLGNLDATNPVLTFLDISNTGLSFEAADTAGGDNFPVVRSAALQSLAFASFKQLTSPARVNWLDGVPALVSLDISGLLNAAINTSCFATASPAFQSIVMVSTPIVPGCDLRPLYRLGQLRTLNLDDTSIFSTLPPNVSAVWPLLVSLSIQSSNLVGALPSFVGLPYLTELDLSQNTLVGTIDPNFAADSTQLVKLDLSQNSLTGALPSLANHAQLASVSLDLNLLSGSLPAPFPFLPSLLVMTLAHNKLGGALPANLWTQLPAIQTIDLSNNQLTGLLPSPAAPYSMDLFAVANNLFVSPLPINIMAEVLDLSANTLSGPLILLDPATAPPAGATYPMRTLNLQSVKSLSCPIDLSMLSSLTSLSIQNGGFADCEFANASLVRMPPSLSMLDISDCDWAPLYLSIPPGLQTLRANRANVFGFAAVGTNHALVELSIAGNLLTEQLGSFSSLFSAAPLIRSLTCSECGLSFHFPDFMALFTHSVVLEQLDLSINAMTGALPATLFSIVGTSALPTSIRLLDLSYNWALTGYLPVGDASFSSLQKIDLGQTGIIGVLDRSWQAFSGLQHIAVDGTVLQGPLSVNSAGKLVAAMPSWLLISSTTFTGFTSDVDNTASFHCPAVFIRGRNYSNVEMDPFYHAHTLCTCDATCFGRTGICYSCPSGCTCNKNMIQNCYPVLQRGVIPVTSTGVVLASQIQPFSITNFLPCPRTLVGQELCNPNGFEWPSFYDVRVITTDSTGATTSETISENVDLSGWCYPGHTGRLCAACSAGYFASGRWCLECLSKGVHVLILMASLLLIAAVVTYLYLKSPGAARSQSALRHYSSKLGRATRGGESQSVTRHHDSISRPVALTPVQLFTGAAGGAATAVVDADVSLSLASPSPSFEMTVETEVAEVVTEAVNPLKLLIFHSQQLSLLLQTTASMPSVIAGLMSAVSSGSNGFSLSSLVAMECLYSSWSIKHRCWLALVAPMLIGLVAGVTYAIDHRHAAAAILPNGSRRVVDDRAERLLNESDAASELPHRASSAFPRIYGVCVSLLYLLVFPCAQTVLSALTCTDTRDTDVSNSSAYLNLFPAQRCDGDWRATILPPALLGAIFWMVAFPLASTVLLLRLKRRLHAHPSADDSAAALSAWPICSDLLSSYAPRFWYWEQILLVRRLLLVAAVTIIPSSSLYLPLALFALIQLCALLQHWTHPYSHALLNAGELLSLYLLLINYISALILQTGLVEGGFQQTANGWAAALFVSNLVFLLLLVAGLFGWFRLWVGHKWAQFVKQRGHAGRGWRGRSASRKAGHDRPRHSRSPSI